MLRSFFEWVFRRHFSATVIARGSNAFDVLRGEIKRDINVLILQMQHSHHSRSILGKGIWTYIVERGTGQYEWRFYFLDEYITVSCHRRNGEQLFSSRDKDQLIPLDEVVNVHKTVTELNWVMARTFGGMRTHLCLFAEAARYYKG